MKFQKTTVRCSLRGQVPTKSSVQAWTSCFGSGRVRSGSGIGTVLVLASLALMFGRAAASDSNWSGSIHIDELLNPGSSSRLVEVPQDGLRVDLWSDPEAGSRVRVGQKGKIYFESNADCYVTILSVDTEGRTSRLFPRHHEDGWVWGGETYRLPDYGSGTDLRFTGPEGVERVFAIATLSPHRDHYPRWLERGRASSWARTSSTYGSLAETGWLLGDPLYELRELTVSLVSSLRNWATYNTAWMTFYVGRSHHHSRPVRACAVCGGLLEVGHNGCGGGYVSVNWEPDFGWIDFSVVVLPRYHYRACRTWRPRLWASVFHDPYPDWRWRDWRVSHRGHGKGRVYTHGHHGWHEPDGRWRDRVEARHGKVGRRHETGHSWGKAKAKGTSRDTRVTARPRSEAKKRSVERRIPRERIRKARETEPKARKSRGSDSQPSLQPAESGLRRRDRHEDRKISGKQNERSVAKSRTRKREARKTRQAGK